MSLYFYHITKTGGASVIYSYLSNFGEPGPLYAKISDGKTHCLKFDTHTIKGWDRRTIEAGDFNFAFSHYAKHQITLPENTTTFTLLRDPVDRVRSIYRTLKSLQLRGMRQANFEEKSAWLGNSFEDFVERLPEREMNNQVFMFSKDMCVEQALSEVGTCDFIGFSDEWKRNTEWLCQQTALQFPEHRVNHYGVPDEVEEEIKSPGKALRMLRQRLQADLSFYNDLLENRSALPGSSQQGDSSSSK